MACGVLAAVVLWDEEVPKLGNWPVRVLLAIGVGVLAGLQPKHDGFCGMI